MEKIKEYWDKIKSFLLKPLFLGLVVWQVGLIAVLLIIAVWYFFIRKQNAW